jgi:HEAT repeat protein
MPLLLAEELDPLQRELTHEHIESCPLCGEEWAAYKATWAMMGDLPDVPVPPRVKQNFLRLAGLAEEEQPAEERPANVVPFTRRPAFKWIAQAAAVVVLVGGAWFAGDYNADRFEPAPLTVTRGGSLDAITPVSLAESRVLDAEALSPEIQGRPNIANVQFADADASDDEIAMSFDVTTHWTVTGNPKDKSIVRLLAYMLENEEAVTPRSGAMEWVRRTYSDPANADPEIANALAKVLRNDTHEGVRIRAVETLTQLPPAEQTREALIEALKSDPNPAVRLKAVEALAAMASKGEALDPATVDTLRAKASQDDENLYVRVKAAEALRNIKPN